MLKRRGDERRDHGAEQSENPHETERRPYQRRHRLMVIPSQTLAERLGERASEAEVEDAEVANDQPYESQPSEALGAESANEDRDSEDRRDRRRYLSDEIPDRVAAEHAHKAFTRPGPMRPAIP